MLKGAGAAMRLLACCGASTSKRTEEVSVFPHFPHFPPHLLVFLCAELEVIQNHTLTFISYLHNPAPMPRKKEGRAARLAALLENENASINSPEGDEPFSSTALNDEVQSNT